MKKIPRNGIGIASALLFAMLFLLPIAFASHGFSVFLDGNNSARSRIAGINTIVDFNFTVKSDWNSANDINKVMISIPADYKVLDVNALGWSAQKPVGDWNSANPIVLMPYSGSYYIKPDKNAVFKLRVSVPSSRGTVSWLVETMDTSDANYSKSVNAYTLALNNNGDIGFDLRNDFNGVIRNATVYVTPAGGNPVSKNDSNGTGLVFFVNPTDITFLTDFFDFNVAKNGFISYAKTNQPYSSGSTNPFKADLNFSVKA
ncbi:MAG: hypothetical protein WC602_05405, partial [archaeon]